jgi:hypothetical protein
MEKEFCLEKDEEVVLEEEDELNDLIYTGESDKPVFELVKVTKKDFSIYELFRKYQKGQLTLEVDFQRKSVWDNKQKCELIESILMGLPLPIFYLKQQNNSTYVVVDGKQRLSTLFDFLQNKFQLKLLKILTFLNGKKFMNLEEEYGIYQAQLEDYQVYSHVILPPTPDKVLFDIFDRVNRGGTKLNKQEIRNALYHGKGLNMIAEISKTKIFEEATGIENRKDSRMKGSYLLTRFLAFYLLFNGMLFKNNKTYEYTSDLDDLIELTLTQLNIESSEKLSELKQITLRCLEMSKDILGRGAFRREMKISNPINMNIFETTLYFMSLIAGQRIASDKIVKGLMQAITSEEYLGYIGNSRENIKNVNGRFNMMKKLSKEIVYD